MTSEPAPRGSLELTVLGTASPAPLPGQPCSGYLLTSGERAVVLDLGPGTLAELRARVALADVDALWISHLHADHWSDLPNLYYALAFGGATRDAPLPVYSPPGCAERLRGFFARESTAFLDDVFTFHDLHDGHVLSVGDLQLVARAVDHDVEAYGVRVQAGTRVLAYTGDSAPCEALTAIATGADLLLAECDYGAPPEGEDQAHLTPEDVSALAVGAGVRRVLVSHVGHTLDPREALERVRRGFTGDCALAEVGGRYPVHTGSGGW